MLKKLLRHYFLTLLFLVALTIGTPVFILTTNPGLHLAIYMARLWLPGKLHISEIQGELLHGFQVKNLSWQYQKNIIHVEKIRLALQWHWSWDSPSVSGNTDLKNMQFQQENTTVELTDFQGKFSGNSLENMVMNSDFSGAFNQLAWKGSLQWKNNNLFLQVRDGFNTLRLMGNPKKILRVQGMMTKPAILHSALKDLQTKLEIKGEYDVSTEQGNIAIRLDKGHLKLPGTSPLPILAFHESHFVTTLEKEKINTTGTMALADNHYLRINFILSDYKDWQGSATLTRHRQSLSLQGKGVISPHLRGDLTLQGTDFRLIDNVEYSLEAKPDLHARFDNTSLELKGHIVIPRARIAPLHFKSSLSLSPDAVFVQKHPKYTDFKLDISLDVEAGEQVFLEYNGLTSQLNGKVHLDHTSTDSWIASGQLILNKGKYKAYGRDLKISEGKLLFTGGIITNPGISLKAVQKFTVHSIDDAAFNNAALESTQFGSHMIVGVAVSGFINNPRITLYSEPATLSQADILSMLLLGKSFSQIEKGGEKLVQEQLILAAIASMPGTRENGLLEQLQKKANIDLAVKNTGNFDSKNNAVKNHPALVIGKKLTENMYVHYDVNLSRIGANRLTLEWLINRFISIQVSSSTADSGIDLSYTSKGHTHVDAKAHS